MIQSGVLRNMKSHATPAGNARMGSENPCRHPPRPPPPHGPMPGPQGRPQPLPLPHPQAPNSSFQTVAQLQPVFPGFAAAILGYTETVSAITIPPSALKCAFRSFTVYHAFWAYMSLPAIGLLHVIAVLWIDATTLCRGVETRSVMHPSQKRKVMQRSFTRGKRPWQLVVTCLVVVFFVLYATLIKQIARLNDCRRYDFGGPGSGVPAWGRGSRGYRGGGGLRGGILSWKISVFKEGGEI